MSDLPLLVDPDWLHGQLDEPDLRVVDCSWYLPDAQRNARAEYEDAHIPGAVHLDLSTDLADLSSAIRNTIAKPDALGRTFGRAGIGSGDRVVLYDRLAGYSAGRVWWALRYAGHERAALLDGGFERWRHERKPVRGGRESHEAASFSAREQPRWRASRRDVLRVVETGGATIVDARGAPRFRGEAPESTRRRGHIPGSVNVPHGANLAGVPPSFKPLHELRELYQEAGVSFDDPVIATCGSGVTASLAAFALVLLGHSDVRVYDGSWAEWGDDDEAPVASGP